MATFYQTVAHIFPGRREQFETVYCVHECVTDELPVNTVKSKGNSHTIERFFKIEEQALKFGRYLFSRYSQPNCLPPPTAHNLGLDLQMEIV